MADEPTTTPHSGSRWEPPTPAPPAESPAPSRTRRLRRRGALLGAAVGLAALGGVGGYAIGQAAAGASDSAVVQDSPDDDGRGFPPDFDDGAADDGDAA